ncbi:PTS sugar transporter subunit IIA [Zophobihabitans entericus]|uniref:PTS sugar transporter subunit IIA n=1 Tax=Zophobihabitans entericus TaxID=1635327 RepID=A0A6G9ICL8_9GAMM|nr:PTS sugar transporter subunit IIA [Zophobihabitans entericus]QIQ21978.1 PTS sugar transporter subunit IIA [Zophobihabitans entericus]
MQSKISEQFFTKSLINLSGSFPTQQAFFESAHQHLHQLGYVNESYLPNILIREQEYPTGLVMPTMNIAIPHTDPSHIIKPFIAVTKLTRPITFMEMGTLDSPVDVDWIFALGVTDGEHQVCLLQALMQFFCNEENVNTLKKLNSVDEIYHFLKERISQ